MDAEQAEAKHANHTCSMDKMEQCKWVCIYHLVVHQFFSSLATIYYCCFSNIEKEEERNLIREQEDRTGVAPQNSIEKLQINPFDSAKSIHSVTVPSTPSTQIQRGHTVCMQCQEVKQNLHLQLKMISAYHSKNCAGQLFLPAIYSSLQPSKESDSVLFGFGGTANDLQQEFFIFYVVNCGKCSIFIKCVPFTIQITWLRPSNVEWLFFPTAFQ